MTLLFSLVAMFGISTVATVAWLVAAPKEGQGQQPVRTRHSEWTIRLPSLSE